MPIKNCEYHVPPELLERRVRVVVVGAGGTGSHVIAHLAVLHQSMVDLGHPEGIHCTVVDSDEVSHANVGRAKFFQADIGVNKATAIVNRVNVCFGLDWKALDLELTESCQDRSVRSADIVIGCVDTRRSRRSIRALLERDRSTSGTLWLDLGNSADDGQVILGEAGTDRADRLPCVTDLYPEMLDESADPTDEGPSCSRAEALLRQSAFVNATCALHAVSMLGALFRFGKIDHSAVFFDVKKSRAVPLACNTEAWARFGWKTQTKRRSRMRA